MLPGKQLCTSCFKDVSCNSVADKQKVKEYIRTTVKEGLKSASKNYSRREKVDSSSPDDSEPTAGTKFLPLKNSDDYPSGLDDEPETHTFNLPLVPALVDAVKEAMKWQEDASPPKKKHRYYPDLKKSISSFPLIFEIQELWRKSR